MSSCLRGAKRLCAWGARVVNSQLMVGPSLQSLRASGLCPQIDVERKCLCGFAVVSLGRWEPQSLRRASGTVCVCLSRDKQMKLMMVLGQQAKPVEKAFVTGQPASPGECCVLLCVCVFACEACS